MRVDVRVRFLFYSPCDFIVFTNQHLYDNCYCKLLAVFFMRMSVYGCVSVCTSICWCPPQTFVFHPPPTPTYPPERNASQFLANILSVCYVCCMSCYCCKQAMADPAARRMPKDVMDLQVLSPFSVAPNTGEPNLEEQTAQPEQQSVSTGYVSLDNVSSAFKHPYRIPDRVPKPTT